MTAHPQFNKILHQVVEAAHHLTHSITQLTQSPGEKIKDLLEQKGLEVNYELRKGGFHDTFNYLSSAAGEVSTNNDPGLTKGLLHQILFDQKGEERLGAAMSSGEIFDLTKVELPSQEIQYRTASKLNEIEKSR